MDLDASVSILKGFGKKRVDALEKENIKTIKDLISFFPSRYEDRTKIGSFENRDHDITIRATILKKGSIRFINSKRNFIIFSVKDDHGNLGEIIFFNQPYLINQLKPDETYYFYGRVNSDKKLPRIYSPKFASIEETEFLTITPIYKKISGVPPALIQKTIPEILGKIKIDDFLPEKYKSNNRIIDLNQMYHLLHQPVQTKDIYIASNRLKLNEALKINAGITFLKNEKLVTDLVINNFNVLKPFIKKLPFELTDSQKWVLRDILRDLESGFLMNRMIQGDVGSGKTIIAIICAYLFCLNGLQVAYMAPTEILAKQHFETFKEYFKDYNFNIELLVGSQNKVETERIREGLRNGTINIVIGTHSLFQENTDFYNLGLIVTDEQHRFGVKQRGQLENKGQAHILVMSATPIPRTLALTFYGDLDLSVIDQMPLGRKKVKTSVHSIKKLNKILKFTEQEIKLGHQAFIVCPFIEESEELKEVISVDKAYREIKKKYGKHFRIESLHSKLSNDEQEKIIDRFNNGEIDLLIATSIIEVGINVPNVSVIIILSADRFGLSQLHQLRGRTGRSSIQSYCFLLSDNQNEITRERLSIIANCHDGQKIAEADLKLRGPGEYFGFQQSGFNSLRFINPLKDKKVFEQAKDLIEEIFKSKKAEDMICKDYLIKEFNNESKYITLD